MRTLYIRTQNVLVLEPLSFVALRALLGESEIEDIAEAFEAKVSVTFAVESTFGT